MLCVHPKTHSKQSKYAKSHMLLHFDKLPDCRICLPIFDHRQPFCPIFPFDSHRPFRPPMRHQQDSPSLGQLMSAKDLPFLTPWGRTTQVPVPVATQKSSRDNISEAKPPANIFAHPMGLAAIWMSQNDLAINKCYYLSR